MLEGARIRLGLLSCSFGKRSQLLASSVSQVPLGISWLLHEAVLLPVPVDQFLRDWAGRCPASSNAGFRERREAGAAPWLWPRERGLVELPLRDVGMDELSCRSLLARANCCVQVSGFRFIARISRMYGDWSPVMWTGLSH